MNSVGVSRWTRRIYLANVVAQTGIVITGAAVRLTGSGLGCPTFPRCTGDSYVPVAKQAQGFHKYIEFGNRTLTFVLLVVTVAAVIAAWRSRPLRKPLLVLALCSVGGIFAQALLGGITVLTQLNPYTVSAHFLLSMALIAVAIALYERSGDAGDAPPVPLVRVEVQWIVRTMIALAGLVVLLGTVVTGSGPHSGDAGAKERYNFDVRSVSWLHADLVLLFIGVLVGVMLAFRLVDAPISAQRRAWVLMGVSLAQGGIGYLQYFLGVPELLVAAHVLGACLVWIFALRVPYALRTRG